MRGRFRTLRSVRLPRGLWLSLGSAIVSLDYSFRVTSQLVRVADVQFCFSFVGRAVEHVEDQINDAQDSWQEVDPDEYSYEELVALGEVVGTESRGLSADTLASLPSVTYKTKDMQDGNTEQCVICRVEFEEGESLVALPCNHSYHPDCINQWLQINKVCPMCSAEVSTSASKQA
uniref:RING-type domain-containing protein n=1 Tax=Aegilops tauschii subsp. strangulata TaxID=200361 RepID=A0A453LG94_AEGTS